MTAPNKKQAIAYYEAHADHYDDYVERGPFKYLRSRERTAILELLRLEEMSKTSFIDVGSGGGYFAMQAKKHGKDVTAIDAAEGMVQTLRGKFDRVLQADIETFVSDRKYDIVLCSGVLEFVVNPDVAFANLSRMVAPGGALVLQVPRQCISGLAYRFEKALEGMGAHLFSLDWLRQKAEEQGLSLVEHRNPLPFNLAARFERPRLARIIPFNGQT